MQPILKGGFIMVNTKEMTESLIKELAFSEEELRELKAAKEKHDEVTLFAGELNKVVRGPITEWAERIFEQK